MQLEVDRALPMSDRGLPYRWLSGEDFEAFESAATSSDLVSAYVRIDVPGDVALFRVDREPDTESCMPMPARSNVGLTGGTRKDDRWSFRLRFDDHDDLAEHHVYCPEKDIAYELDRVYSDRKCRSADIVFDLTPEPADTVTLAIERGYYRVPREVTLNGIGDELGVSPRRPPNGSDARAIRIFGRS